MMRAPAGDEMGDAMNQRRLERLDAEAEGYLSALQPLLTLPAETVPQVTAVEARKALTWAAGRLGTELVEIKGAAPTFLLLPPGDSAPDVTLLATWHAESMPVTPAALEGAERLALAASLAAAGAVAGAGAAGASTGAAAAPTAMGNRPRVAVVVPPAATHGSLVLLETLATHRERLRAPVAFWPRVTGPAPARRRVFLGARGRVVIGLWGEGGNPYALRDGIVLALGNEAYGPRPLDFELLRKLALNAEALEFLEESSEDPDALACEVVPATRLRVALFEPRGRVLTPPVRHPDRPRAWLVFETAENMDAADILARVEAGTGGSRAELAEGFPWDRLSIHHPSIQALVRMAKSRSEGAEIWPMAPWATPSGAFSRTLGIPLAEWGVPLPAGSAVRQPSPEAYRRLVAEIAELVLRGAGLSESET